MECFCFVILHYQTQNDTIECVDSILKNCVYKDYHIVVVDNGSPNKSGELLTEHFNENPKVTVIINKKNLGFTDGNNVGFKYARYQLNAEFIALINNDTLIEQKNFIEAIIEKHKSNSFDILGPDIITVSGKHQNPVFNKLSSLQAVENYLRFYKKILLLNYLAIDKLLEKIKKTFIPESNIHLVNINVAQDHSKEQERVMLHGSALIFSRSYIARYEGLYHGPFMYGEEAILDFIAKRDYLKTIYSPDIKIIHKDDSSTNYTYKKPLIKRRFYLKNQVRSLNVLQALMKEEND